MTDIVDLEAERRKHEERPNPAHRYVDKNGAEWFEFIISWTASDGEYLSKIWALSLTDAECRLKAMQTTGRVEGQAYTTIEL